MGLEGGYNKINGGCVAGEGLMGWVAGWGWFSGLIHKNNYVAVLCREGLAPSAITQLYKLIKNK